jgi:hypothetical protein
MSQEFYVATLTTRHFAFEAYGDSESAAQATLLRGLKLHLKQYPLAKIREMMTDAEIHFVRLGECYRDRTPMGVPA